MPCYTVNTMSVEFKAENRELLLESLKNLNATLFDSKDSNYIRFYFDKANMMINLKTNKIEAAGYAQSSFFDAVNKIKRSYARTVITTMAKKKKWAVRRRTDGNKLQLVKY